MLQLNRQKLIPEGPIVRAAEFQTVLDAEAIIADAEHRAAQISQMQNENMKNVSSRATKTA